MNQAYVIKKSAGGKTPYEAVQRANPLPTTLPKDSAVVDIIASALNHRDNWITQGMYPGITEGVTLGSDCVGICASSPNSQWIGKRVVLDPSVGWGNHSPLAPKGKLSILGTPLNGTFAKQICIPEANLRLCPEFLTNFQAAALPLAGVTAYRAVVTKGQCRPGSNVLVTGIGGGVAIFAVQIAVALGANVYVTSSNDDKLERSHKTLGSKGGANYKTDPKWTDTLVKQLGGKNIKFDLVVDGGGEVGALIKLTAGGGKIVSYGATASPSVQLVLPQLFLNNIDLLGTAMGSPEDFDGLVALVNAKRIIPVVDEVFDFTEFPIALDKMRQGKQFGKLVLDHSKL
ncbi:hypothetical protein BASA81_015743 [Batrachochytrium salamandrivorans]|nr:hypothetical protein BASA81_015743 [Batrachochytrium salamandrivorans]